MQQQCSGITKAGGRCRGRALPGSAYCIAHDPARVVELAEYRRQGGKAKSNAARARREIERAALTPNELQGILGVTIKAVLAGAKPPGIGQAVAALARAAMSVREQSEIETRLAALEEATGQSGRRFA